MDSVEASEENLWGLVTDASRRPEAPRIIANSEGIQRVFQRVARFSRSDAPVVVFGETGTGKEVIARLLHANSARAEEKFVPVNVAALPEELLESELFGHGRGAFTGAVRARQGLFEVAHRGTLFLDEVGELPLSLQAKLLRALQDGEIRRVGENHTFKTDVRIICATHRDLALQVQDGVFREDLYYRLKVLSVTVPPLRERLEDIMPIAMGMLASEPGELQGFTPEAEALLLAYAWPGNVRELQNAVKHGAALADGAWVAAEDLPDEVRETHSALKPRTKLLSLAEVEQAHILAILDASDGCQTTASEILGIARNTLWRKLRTYGLERSGGAS